MKRRSKLLLWCALIAVPLALAFGEAAWIGTKAGGLYVTSSVTQKWASHGATPTVQRASALQAAILDATGGTASGTAAVTTGVTTVAIPIQLASMTTAAADLVTSYVPGYKFKILQVDFVTTTIGAGSGASQTINLEIGTTNLTGGVVNVTLAGTDTLGEISAGSGVSLTNTGTALSNISVEVAASGTVFTAGEGILLVKIQNMDTADTAASLLQLTGELRTALVEKGLIKGGP